MDQLTTKEVIIKIEKLLAMTSSPHVEEARTSAWMACKLIRQHDLQVVAISASPELPRRPAATEEWLCIYTKYPCRCRQCSKDILVGRRVWWRKGWGVHCMSCKHPEQ